MWGTAMDVGGWLRNLGLDRYEASFRDNGVGADVLPHLTAEDLRELGVASIGDRRRLLVAIAALAGGTPPADVSASPLKSAPPKDPQLSAERRPITIMFCDLVGSTSLAAKLDAEDSRNLVGGYLDAASEAVSSLGGHVLKRLGDGLLALFGYPQAQENDAERAVRAALAIQRALAELNARSTGKGAPDLAARIGLDSGPVVVDATGEVFGEAPNVAARVQALGEPGGSFISAATDAREAIAVADEKGAFIWKAAAKTLLGCTFAFSGETSNAVETIASGIAAWRATGSTLWMPLYLLGLARAHAQLGQFDNAWAAIDEASTTVATTSEKWCEAELFRAAGETALMSPEPDTAKAQAYFDRALALARAQQAKSWELRAAMSLARIWRDQGKRDAARGLLAPVYGWFTEGFDTLDLKEAKAVLDALA
jgi:class 3 adenylate cyclase